MYEHSYKSDLVGVELEPGRAEDLNQGVSHEKTDVDPTQVRLGKVELWLEHDLQEGDRFPQEVAQAIGAPGQGKGYNLASCQPHCYDYLPSKPKHFRID